MNKNLNDITDFNIGGGFGGSDNNQIADNTGKIYFNSDISFKFAGKNSYGGSVSTQLMKGIQTQGEIIIKGVPEDANKLVVIKIRAYSYREHDFPNELIDFRNVPIY